MKNVIFHHNDADGFTAAAVCIRHILLENHLAGDNYILIKEPEYNELIKTQVFGYHGSLLDYIDIVDPDDHVYIVDLSFTEDTMDQLVGIWDKVRAGGGEIRWIDHHKSSIELIKAHPELDYIPGCIDSEYCGAYLAQKYFFRDEDIPTFIYYVDKYDCFKDVSKDVQILMLGYQANSKDLDYKGFNYFWFDLVRKPSIESTNYLQKMGTSGTAIYDYRESKFKSARKRIFYGYLEATGFENMLIPFLNTDEASSLVFGDIYDQYPAVCVFRTDGKTWRASLYANINKYPDTDCSIAAESLGGGGHQGAAGFCIDNGKSIFDYITVVEMESEDNA